MTPYLTALKLTDAELDRLDGHCEPATQAAVDSMRARLALADDLSASGLTDGQVRLVHDVITRARVAGSLTYSHEGINRCGYCGAEGGYAKHKRSGRYHRKGDPDYKRPTYVSGIDYARGFVTMRGHVTVGACRACCEGANPVILSRLATMPTALPVHFPGAATMQVPAYGGPSTVPRVVKHDLCRCSTCQLVQHEGEMGLLPAIVGGYYPSQCKRCGAKRMPIAPSPFVAVPGWVVWDAAERRVLRASPEALAALGEGA